MQFYVKEYKTHLCFVWVIHFEISTILALLLRPAILNDTEGIIDSLDTVYQKLPYDKVAMSVKRIDAFRKGDPGRGAVLFDPKPMRRCPESLPA
jgi:hypothetical protein